MKQWQTPHLPILTSRQLELSLLEIDRRKRKKKSQRQDALQASKKDDNNSNDQASIHSASSDNNSSDDIGNKQAAILIPLCTVRGIPSILFTRRSASLSNHASQISFPGGYYDEQLDNHYIDDTIQNEHHHGHDQQHPLINTALRETQEELNYNIFDLKKHLPIPNSLPLLTILGQTQPVPSMIGSKVTPILAMINYDLPHYTSPEFKRLFPGNVDEVDWIFTMSIGELIDGERSEPLERWNTSYSHDDDNDAIDGQDKRLEIKKKQGKAAVLGPVFPIPEGDENKRDGDKIWGLTAIVLRPLLRKVFGPVFFGNEVN